MLFKFDLVNFVFTDNGWKITEMTFADFENNLVR